MSSSTEYQAISAPSSDAPVSPQNNARYGFLSLFHLSNPKAIVLATVIVCITFATFHYNNYPTANAYNQFLGRSSFPPSPVRLSLDRVCESLSERPNVCQNNFERYKRVCTACGMYPETIRATAGADVANIRLSLDRICESLSRRPDVCQNNFERYTRVCTACGMYPETIRGTTDTDIGSTRISLDRICKSLGKRPEVCQNNFERYTRVCTACGMHPNNV